MNCRVVCMLALVALLALLALPFASSAQEAPAAASATEPLENLSEGRAFGLGLQGEFPWGGLLSARYWATERWGVEGVFFVLADGGDVSGIATARALYRAVDAATVDFYVAAGPSFQLSLHGGEPIIGSLVGGIEINFSRGFAWNVEFGLAANTLGQVWTAFGTGIHFYF
jgi:hypothetical protein